MGHGPWTRSMGWSMDWVHEVVHGPRSMFCIPPFVFEWVRKPNSLKQNLIDWVRLCSTKFDWFGKRTHTKFGVRFGSIEFDFTMPGCTFMQCKTESLTFDLKIYFYLNSPCALLYKQQQKNSLIALNSALLHVTTGKEHAKKASMYSLLMKHDGSIRLQLKSEAST